MTGGIEVLVSLAPVVGFAVALLFLDSYKLVRFRTVVQALFVGCVAAGVCYAANRWFLDLGWLAPRAYFRFVAPVLEETFKGLYVVYLIRRQKVGFAVDAAICGFAVGAGFAFLENIYYLYALETHNLGVWVTRGFGTAIMHGGTTSILAILAKSLTDSQESHRWELFLPAFGSAILLHAAFNQFILPPTLSTVVLLLTFPVLIAVVFTHSERSLRTWLGVGFDSDLALLTMIRSGHFLDTKLGHYLQSLKAHFPGDVIADIFCYVRLHVELGLTAKGILMAQEAGFKTGASSDIQERLRELRYLEKSIGKTGRLAVIPLLRTRSRDLWQLELLAGR